MRSKFLDELNVELVSGLSLFWAYFATTSLALKLAVISETEWTGKLIVSFLADALLIVACLSKPGKKKIFVILTILISFIIFNSISLLQNQNCQCFGPKLEIPVEFLLAIESISCLVLICGARISSVPESKSIRKNILPYFGMAALFVTGLLLSIEQINESYYVLKSDDQLSSLPISGLDPDLEDCEVLFYSKHCGHCKKIIAQIVTGNFDDCRKFVFVDIDEVEKSRYFRTRHVIWTNAERKIWGLGQLPARFVAHNGKFIRK